MVILPSTKIVNELPTERNLYEKSLFLKTCNRLVDII